MEAHEGVAHVAVVRGVLIAAEGEHTLDAAAEDDEEVSRCRRGTDDDDDAKTPARSPPLAALSSRAAPCRRDTAVAPMPDAQKGLWI